MTKKSTRPGPSNSHVPDELLDRPAEPQDPTAQPSGSPAQKAPDGGAIPPGESPESLQALRSELRDAEGRALRLQADLDNFRKRSRREMEDATRFATLPLLRDLLPVIDNLQRAIAAESGTAARSSLLDGIRMVAQQLAAVLETYDCHPIEAAGETFDPTWHEAIAQQPSQDVPPGAILEVAQTGYRLHDRVIRPAQVVVARPPDDL